MPKPPLFGTPHAAERRASRRPPSGTLSAKGDAAWLPLGEVSAQLLQTSQDTIRRLCESGAARAELTPGAQWRLPQSEVTRLKKEETLDWFRQREREERARREELERQRRLQEEEAERQRRHQRWFDRWQKHALDCIPFSARRQVESNVYTAVAEVLGWRPRIDVASIWRSRAAHP